MSYALPPRPSLSPDEMAALVVAAQELLKKEMASIPDPPPSWRFSGRWFDSGRYVLRRPYRVS